MKKFSSFFNLLLATSIFLMLVGCRKGFMENQADPLSGIGKQGGALTTLNGTLDVYVAGSEGSQATYWKNGVGVILPGGEVANGIAVDDSNNVHVSGFGHDSSTGLFVAKYWRNGILTNLSDGTNSVIATGIAVSGTNVYIAGTAGAWVRTGVLWTNGVATSLGSGQPNGVVVANGDIYIPNSASGGPSYWKNGTLITIPGTSGEYANAMAVKDTNVYVVGVKFSGINENARYWKNGVSQTIFQGVNSVAMAVAVTAIGDEVKISGTSGSDLNNMKIGTWSTPLSWDLLGTGKFVAITTGIALDGTDVYVCGSEYSTSSTPQTRARYWKNTQVFNLSNGSTDGTALAITVVPAP